MPSSVFEKGLPQTVILVDTVSSANMTFCNYCCIEWLLFSEQSSLIVFSNDIILPFTSKEPIGCCVNISIILFKNGCSYINATAVFSILLPVLLFWKYFFSFPFLEDHKPVNFTGDFALPFFAKIDLFDELFSKNLIICAPSSVRVFPSHTGLFTFKILVGVTLTTYLLIQ